MARKAKEVKLLDKAPSWPESVNVRGVRVGLKQVGEDGKPLLSDGNAVKVLKDGTEKKIPKDKPLPTLETVVDLPVLSVNKDAAAGLKAFIETLSAAEPGIENYGPRVVASFVNDGMLREATVQLHTGTVDNAPRLRPRIRKPRTVDVEDIAGKNFAAWMRANPGKVPTAKDMKDIQGGKDLTALYAGLVK